MHNAIDIDRTVPPRPPGRRAGSQKWRDLLFLHWEVSAPMLRTLVPPEFDLDLWDGRALVGLVPFTMRDVRVAWAPGIAFNFLETNVRTYVHYNGVPGVYFLSLDAASCLAVWAARLTWGLPYFHARMRTRLENGVMRYTTVRRCDEAAHLDVTAEIGDALPPSEPGTAQYWLLERYYLYLVRRGRVLRGQVVHVPYAAHSATLTAIDDGLVPALGLDRVGVPPVFAHYSPGVDVDVYGLQVVG